MSEYIIVPIPSEGEYYRKFEKNNDTIDKIKVLSINSDDEDIMFSPSIVSSGKLIDELVARKFILPEGMTSDDLLEGDYDTLLLALRSTMSQTYHIKAKDPKTDEEFDYEYDLNDAQTITYSEIADKPNENGEFEYHLENSGKNVRFRLATVADRKLIDKVSADMMKDNPNRNFSTIIRRKLLVTHVDGCNSDEERQRFLSKMNIVDGWKLAKYMKDVTPKFDNQIEIVAPSGNRFRTKFPITEQFFYPSI